MPAPLKRHHIVGEVEALLHVHTVGNLNIGRAYRIDWNSTGQEFGFGGKSERPISV